jgi:hypothetical protein
MSPRVAFWRSMLWACCAAIAIEAVAFNEVCVNAAASTASTARSARASTAACSMSVRVHTVKEYEHTRWYRTNTHRLYPYGLLQLTGL